MYNNPVDRGIGHYLCNNLINLDLDQMTLILLNYKTNSSLTGTAQTLV